MTDVADVATVLGVAIETRDPSGTDGTVDPPVMI
jgi:hypothetical protein